jgi:N-acetylglucosaminyldiphosphoundecaprenol N-acetyl-beta-D-mannosaminyltransferase
MEHWIIGSQARYKGGVFLAVGDAFTLLSGRRKFAPRWMQRFALTWFYRLCTDPRRLGPRYLRYNSLFVLYAIPAMLKDMLGWKQS